MSNYNWDAYFKDVTPARENLRWYTRFLKAKIPDLICWALGLVIAFCMIRLSDDISGTFVDLICYYLVSIITATTLTMLRGSMVWKLKTEISNCNRRIFEAKERRKRSQYEITEMTEIK